MFDNMSVFLSVYIPLAILGFFGIIYEQKLIKLETKVYKVIKAMYKSIKKGGQNNA